MTDIAAALIGSCATPGCERTRQRDARLCSACLTDRWLLREPEVVRITRVKRLVKA